MIKRKKAQGWGMDLIIGFVIFSIGIVIFYLYAINGVDESKETMDNLFYDGKIIASTLLSPGYPIDWRVDVLGTNVNTTAIKIGIASNNILNNTKLEYFYNLTSSSYGYNLSKKLFNTNYDYYFFLDGNITFDNGAIQVAGIGKPGYDKNRIITNSTNLIRTTRLTIYNNRPITAYVYVWQE